MKTLGVQRDANILGGALVFSGTRVPVQALFDYLERSSLQKCLEDFPTVTRGAERPRSFSPTLQSG